MMANKLAGPFLQNSLHSQKTLFQRRERLRMFGASVLED
ncbi:hypothetical protein IMCC3135_07620 [Granulosicoccus antarcticus IMCC3135]|uniref:Uncharacterized protein n=1 Tax=Granulosicoccus antarcticus IMCC3135 TaxID=1192854 RepID=A0A2Z2NKD2_9GAMM|nr:hypothetical protein IMCC3135_07620 [Granulosicoccus antarcticus IMCC3135]